jgi:hypothetical protein
MLFNLTTHTSFSCKDPLRAIQCSKDRGPHFGFLELSAFNEPFIIENAFRSLPNESVYEIPLIGGINMLTNQGRNYYRYSRL